MARPRVPLLKKIEASSVKVPESGCWIWMKSLNHRGYGKTCLGKEKTISAHRASYEEKYGKIPNGLMALHSCDVRCCVNPDHIFLGTQQDNMTDKVNKKRQANGEKHGMSKLTKEQAFEAKFGTEKAASLSKRFGCSATIIRQIRNGYYWKHLENT
jgi:hypothetical protein